MSIGTDVNRTIDEALAAFAYGVGTIEVAIESGCGEEALPTLASLHTAFQRMSGLARLSATPFDRTEDAL